MTNQSKLDCIIVGYNEVDVNPVLEFLEPMKEETGIYAELLGSTLPWKGTQLTYVSLVCGFPGETEQSIEHTIAFIQDTKPDFYHAELFWYDLRSPIRQKAKELGLEGEGYTWQHHTMNWQQAIQHKRSMLERITESSPIPLLGCSLWGIAYLIARGFQADEIKEFGRISKDVLVRGMDGEEMTESQHHMLQHLFRRVRIS